MTTLITGSEGFIGSQLQLPDSIGLDIKSSADIVHDIRFPLPRIENIDSVVHLAAMTGIQECAQNKKMAYATNVAGTWNVLNFCRENDVEHLVFASSAAIYRNQSYYAVLKHTAEFEILKHCRTYGTTASLLRIANVYGLGFPRKPKLTVIHKFILQALLGQELTIYGDGEQIRDFVNVEDVCQAIEFCLNHKIHGIKYVGTQQFTTINELADLITEQMKQLYNREVHRVHLAQKNEPPFKLEIPEEHLFGELWQPDISLVEGIREILLKLSQAF